MYITHSIKDLFLSKIDIVVLSVYAVYNISFLATGVYAWIGINFVLGRFNHVHNGRCQSKVHIYSVQFWKVD